jgi:flagellar protein FlaG
MPVANVGTTPVSSLPLHGEFYGQTVRHPPTAVRHPPTTARQPEETAKEPEETAREPETNKAKPHVIHSTAADLEQIGLVFNRKLRFIVDYNSHEVIVKVIDKETDKVIKELSPEELQRLHSNLKETIGFLFDERV